MGRPTGSYGYVGRRGGSAAWQWIIIGAVLGFGCAAIVGLAGLAFGVVQLEGVSIANLPSPTPVVIMITATPAPVTPTSAPSATAITPTQPMLLEVNLPTASPTVLVALQPTTAPTIPLLGDFAGTPVGGTGALLAGTPGTVGGAAAPIVASAADRLRAVASEMARVPGADFVMGTTAQEVIAAVEECLAGYGGTPGTCSPADGEDSSPQHRVTISDFMIETTEVTYRQYLTFINGLGAGSHRNGCIGFPCMQTQTENENSNVSFDGATYRVLPAIENSPMTNVTWYGAQAYCQAIGRRLPTEAEWERAARGDTSFIYPWGSTWDATRASTNRPADPTFLPAKVDVNSFPLGASPYGALNMAGNVEEWVSDWYDPRFYSSPEATLPNTQGPASGDEKVTRGGAWDFIPFFSRTVHRRSLRPNDPTGSVGFRCAAAINAEGAAAGNAPIGANLSSSPNDLALPAGTINPATLGGAIGGLTDEGDTTANSQPTLPPAPTIAPTLPPTQPPAVPTLAGTLASG